ncbi:BLUF domain-containing protein [Enterovibrio paralichthyis]|uniref:BLUF domain-containing protein n=1 Tax=Enterovibrio paralichthyis TaxID=2853805 RepID=UPI001C471604|nr:BLUF domain-containing protein [Enterovibrio paralichthyis]MBV7299280.1 BLUF domain-containing protein [Enterovibrio paralichthyis]
MSDELQQVVYISSAEHLFSDEEFAEMLATIRAKNERLGVTGMLLYKDGDFIQVIEGRPEVLGPLFDTISRDPRHYSIVELMRKNITERQFSNWSMGFHHINVNDPRLAGFNRFFDDVEHENVDPGEALNLLLVFRE